MYYDLSFLTWFYKIGRISANNGPILKIQNLARSGLRRRSVWCHNDVMRDATCETTSRAREGVSNDAIVATITFWCAVAMGCCYGPISLTARWISLIFGRQTDMTMKVWHTKNCHHSSNIKGTGQFLLNAMATVWLPWKPMPLGSAQYHPWYSCRVCGQSVHKRQSS